MTDFIAVVTPDPHIVNVMTSGLGTVTVVSSGVSGGSGATALDDLTDVTIDTPVSGDVLTYNGANWGNTQPSGVASLSTGLASLSTGLSTSTSGVTYLSTGLSTAFNGVTSLSTGLSTGLSTTNSSLTSLSTGLSTGSSGITSLSTGLSTTNSSLVSLSTGTASSVSSLSTAIGGGGGGGVTQTSGTTTPVILGGAVAGAGTYMEQSCVYVTTGDICTFWMAIDWTAHTGSGALKVTSGLPPALNPTLLEVDPADDLRVADTRMYMVASSATDWNFTVETVSTRATLAQSMVGVAGFIAHGSYIIA